MLQSKEQNGVRIFDNPNFGQLRLHQDERGKFWFCLSDVCKALEIGNPSQVKTRLKREGVITNEGVSLTTNQHGKTTEQVVQMTFIDEPNVYRCIFQSRKKEAEQFQNWVFEEVLPAIRQTGGYIATNENDTEATIMAKALLIANDTIKRTQQELSHSKEVISLQSEELKKQAPKVEYYDKVLQSNSTYTFTQAAKEFGLRCAKQLTTFLQSLGYIFRQGKNWMPYAKYAGDKLFTVRTYTFSRQDGTQGTNSQLVITEKGRQRIHTLLTENENETQTTKTVQQWS